MADETSNTERVDGEQTPLLPSANQAARRKPTTRQLENKRRTCRMLIWIIIILFFVFICIPLLTSLISEIWPCHWWPKEPWQCPYQPEPRRPPPTSPPLISPPSCPDPHFTQTFEYTFEDLRAFSVQEQILIPNVKSKVHIVGADYDQRHAVVVKVQVNATSANDVQRIQIFQDEARNKLVLGSSEKDLAVMSKEQAPFEGCGAVETTVYVRRSSEFYNGFDVNTHRGDIELGENVDLESSQAVLSSVFGHIASRRTMTYPYALYAARTRKMYVSTRHNGSIIGQWSIGEDLAMHTVDGDVRVVTTPYASHSYWTTTYLNVTTSKGDVDFSSFSDEPTSYGRIRCRTLNSTISSLSGDITGVLSHAEETTLVTEEGLINVILTPENVSTKRKSCITTRSPRGSTNLVVADPSRPAYNGIVPLMTRVVSVHEAGTNSSGSLWLTYPSDWSGHLNGSVEDGIIALRGTFDDDIEDDGITYGTAAYSKVANGTIEKRRGAGTSELNFKVGKGNAVVVIGAFTDSAEVDRR